MANSVALIGVPSSVGGIPRGSEQGPIRLREAGIVARLAAVGVHVSDLGDVPVSGRLRNAPGVTTLAQIETVARWVGKHAWRAHAEGMVPLVVGGDHSAAIGNIGAAAQCVPGLGLVWIDAHPDFNTPETSPTGNIHGMVLAIAAGRGHAPLVRLMGFAPMVHPERIVVIGTRTTDAGESNNLREAGVRVYEAEYLERHGMRDTVGDAMAYLARNQVRAVHLSVDMDVLDPSLWPGVSTPVPGGITADDLVEAARMIGRMAPIVSMDLAELTPPEDSGDATVQAALNLAEAALSQSYRAESGGRLHPTAAA
jgi:arginase